MRISFPLIALILVGCSGVEPDFIYTSQQADEVNKQLEKLTTQPIQKYIVRVELTDQDRANLEEALPLIDRIIQFDPITVNAYALKGKIHLALGDPAAAKATYLEAIAKSIPNNTDLDKTIRSDMYVDLGSIHYSENDLKNAERALNKAIELADTAPEAHVLLGRVYQKTDRLNEAKEEALKALLLNADYEPARVFYQEINANPKASP